MHPTDTTPSRPRPAPSRRLRRTPLPPRPRLPAPSASWPAPQQAPHGNSAHDFLMLGALPELCIEATAT